MHSNVEARYQKALTELGVRTRWYQTDTDLYYAAVIGAVDGIQNADIIARARQFDVVLPPTHALHLIKQTLAAITASRDLEVEAFVADVDAVTEPLRKAVRSKRLRKLAGAVVVATNNGGFEVVADRVGTMYTARNEKYRLRTNALDLTLAGITDAAGLDPVTALDRAEAVDQNLTQTGYSNEWDVARILAIDESRQATDRFLRLASEQRGRRRKPLTDRRHLIAVAALADHPSHELVDLVSHRFESLRAGRFRPDQKTRLTLAALLTLGASVPPENKLRTVFHGFAIREHYVSSYAEATSG